MGDLEAARGAELIRTGDSGNGMERGEGRLAYLTTAYPEVSHTFIRREILELERRGHEIVRLSVRRPSSRLVDPEDLAEQERTTYVLARPLALIASLLRRALLSPLRTLAALGAATSMWRRSDRGLLRHLAYLAEAARVVDLCLDRQVAHVHVHFGTNAAAVALLGRTLGGPGYSLTVHGPDEFDAPVGLSLARKVAGSAFTVGISAYGSAQLRRWTDPVLWSRIHVVHCSIDDGFAAARPVPVPADSRALVCVGRLSAQKGQVLLVRALAALAAEDLPARLVLVGDGELRETLEAEIRERGLESRVRITGWATASEVRAELEAARALVLPSFAEGLPVVIMEALALGRPVISTYVAGIPELVVPGQSGWLVPAGDPDALADAMRQALGAPAAKLDAMGATGREAVLERHTTADQIDRLEALLRAAVGRGF